MKKQISPQRRIGIVIAVVIVALGALLAWHMTKEPSQASNTQTQQSDTSTPPTGCSTVKEDQQVCESDYIGLSEADAAAKAEAAGLVSRVIERDGEKLAVTLDLRNDRLNFVVASGKVTAVEYN